MDQLLHSMDACFTHPILSTTYSNFTTSLPMPFIFHFLMHQNKIANASIAPKIMA
jgi:hypothetical protein